MSHMPLAVESPPRAHGAIATVSIVATWGFALLPVNLVPMIVGELVERFAVPLDVAGAVATSMTLINAAVVLSMRRVLARGHRRAVSGIGVAIAVGAYLLAALLPVAPVVVAALLIGGGGAGLMVAAATASLSSMENPDRTTAIGMIINRISIALIFLLIPVLGGTFEVMMWMLVVIGCVTFVLSRRLPPPVVPTTATAALPVAVVHARRGLAWVLAIAFAAWTITDEGTYALIEIFISTNIPGIDIEELMFLYPGATLTGLLGAISAPFLLRFGGRAPSLGVLFALGVVAKFLLASGSDSGTVIAAALVWGFTTGAIIPLIFGLAAAAVSDGRVSVLVNGIYTLGAALGPLVSTQLLVRSSPVWVGVALAVIGVIAAIVTLVAVVGIDRALGLEHGTRRAPRSSRPA